MSDCSDRPRTLAVLRRVDGLFELRAQDGGRTALEPLAGDGGLARAWRALAGVREIRPGVLDAIRTVLERSRIDPFGDEPRARPLQIEAPPRPHVPTAANPRAYKGTKDRPPKPRRPGPQDLRPHLCSFAAQDRLLAAVARELGVPAGAEVREYRDAPRSFRRLFAWTLRDRPEAARALLRAHWTLRLDDEAPLLEHLAVLCARDGGAVTVAWCDALMLLDAAVRAPLTRELLRHEPTDATLALALPRLQQFVAAVQRCTGEDAQRHRAWLVSCLCGGHDLAAAARAVALARPGATPGEGPLAAAADADRISILPRDRVTDALALWTSCRDRPGLGGLAGSLARDDLRPEAARVLADMLTWGLEEPGRWPAQRRELPAAFDAVARVTSPWQPKAAAIVAEVVATHGADELAAGLALCGQVIRAVCAEPCAAHGEIAWAAERVVRLEAAGRGRFDGLPAACWRALDDACRRGNEARRIGRGLFVLGETAVSFARSAWIAHPAGLLRAARTLGTLSFPYAESVLEGVIEGPLWCDPSRLDARELAARLAGAGARRGVQPVSRRLRQHLAGERTLAAAQLERDTQLVRDAWTAVVCDAIAEQCLLRLARAAIGEPAGRALDDPALRHAVLLYGDVEDSRRSLRRLLQAHARGDPSHAERHPENVRWRRDNAWFDFEAWSRGTPLERRLPDGRTIRIAIERDPLEALRLGTHVGSCFGLGGSFNHSAVAVALDANKQVAFARDAGGAFVARQIVAITDDRRLACFAVYPLGSPPAVKRAFRDWDRALAAALGIGIADRETQSEPDIAMLVAGSWWHDGLWEKDLGGGVSPGGA